MIYFRKGKLTEELIGLDLAQPAFRTGYGFFETIAWNGNKICHLDLHLARARKSLAQFNLIEEAIDYRKAILDVVEANKLENEFARVNIFFPAERRRTFPIVSAVPFEYISDRVWSLKPNTDIFLSSLMQHKTMNRMSYLNAWQDAVDSGFDDALLLDFEGNILESSFASLLFQEGDRFIEPQTEYKLPGTAQFIAAKHILIESEPVQLASINQYDHVYALNSLGGMIPISAIGEAKFKTNHTVSDKLSNYILEL